MLVLASVVLFILLITGTITTKLTLLILLGVLAFVGLFNNS